MLFQKVDCTNGIVVIAYYPMTNEKWTDDAFRVGSLIDCIVSHVHATFAWHLRKTIHPSSNWGQMISTGNLLDFSEHLMANNYVDAVLSNPSESNNSFPFYMWRWHSVKFCFFHNLYIRQIQNKNYRQI